MNWLQHWKVVLALVVLFVSGAATGTLITLKVVKRVVEGRSNPERVPQFMLHEYERRLDLTPEQMEKIRPIVQLTGREMMELRGEMSGRAFQIFRRSNEKIAAALTPEQKQRFEELQAELRDRYRAQGQQGPQGLQRPQGFQGPQGPQGPPRSPGVGPGSGPGMFQKGPGQRPPLPGQRPPEQRNLKEADK
ncbi:MAG: hypothetical protein WCS99_15610 [Limisphaerales bacterium]